MARSKIEVARILANHAINQSYDKIALKHYISGIIAGSRPPELQEIIGDRNLENIDLPRKDDGIVIQRIRNTLSKYPGIQQFAEDYLQEEIKQILASYMDQVRASFPDPSTRPQVLELALQAINADLDYPDKRSELFQYVAHLNFLYQATTRLAEHPINNTQYLLQNPGEIKSVVQNYTKLIQELFPNPSQRPEELNNALMKISAMSDSNIEGTLFTAAYLNQQYYEALEYLSSDETKAKQLFLEKENAIRETYKLTDDKKMQPYQLIELKHNPAVLTKWLHNYSIFEVFQGIARSVPQHITREEKAVIEKGLRDFFATNFDDIQSRLYAHQQTYAELGLSNDRYFQRISKDAAFSFLTLNVFSNTPSRPTQDQLRAAEDEYKDLVFNFYPNDTVHRRAAGRLLQNIDLRSMHEDYRASLSASQTIRNADKIQSKYSKYEAHQFALQSAFLQVSHRAQLYEILHQYRSTIQESFPALQQAPASIRSADAEVQTLQDKLLQTQSPISDDYIRTSLHSISFHNSNFLNQMACEAKIDAIVNKIATTDWSLGIGGGVTTTMADSKYQEVTKKLPRTLAKVIATINSAKKDPSTDWKALLENIGGLLSEASKKTVLSRFPSTQKFYESASQEIDRLLKTFSAEQRLLYHPIHHPELVAPEQIKATIDNYRQVVNGIFNQDQRAQRFQSPEVLNPLIEKLLNQHDIHHPERIAPGQIKITIDNYAELVHSLYPDNRSYADSLVKSAVDKCILQKLSTHDINQGVNTGDKEFRAQAMESYFKLLDEISKLPWEPINALRDQTIPYQNRGNHAYVFLANLNKDFLAKQKLQSLLTEIRDTKWNCGFGGIKTTIGDKTVKLPSTLAKVVELIKSGKDGYWSAILTDVEKSIDKVSGSAKSWSRHEDTQKFYNRMKGELKDIREAGQPQITTPRPR